MTFRSLVTPLLFLAGVGFVTDTPSVQELDRQALHGSCQVAVNVQFGGSNHATRHLIAAHGKTDQVPPSAQLVMENVSAHSTGPPIGEIVYPALCPNVTLKAQRQPTFIPLILRRHREGVVQTRYLASSLTLLNAGHGTIVTRTDGRSVWNAVKLTLEPDIGLPLGAVTSCDVHLQGHLRRVLEDPL